MGGESLHCGNGETEPGPAATSAVSEAMHHIGDLGPPGPCLAGRYFFISHAPENIPPSAEPQEALQVRAGRAAEGGPLPACWPMLQVPISPPLQVLSQLEACGLVETVHISAAGFPIR